MRVYEHRAPESMSARSHPWTDSVADPAHRYRDFRAEPASIRSSLEDFRPWEAHSAVETLYRLLEWLNGPGSVFESNDCAFDGPSEHGTAGVPMRLQCSGRLMILFRHLPTNTVRAEVQALKGWGHSVVNACANRVQIAGADRHHPEALSMEGEVRTTLRPAGW